MSLLTTCQSTVYSLSGGLSAAGGAGPVVVYVRRDEVGWGAATAGADDSGNDGEMSALTCWYVAVSTAPAGLEGAHPKGVVAPLVVVALPFSQAAGEGSVVKSTFPLL